MAKQKKDGSFAMNRGADCQNTKTWWYLRYSLFITCNNDWVARSLHRPHHACDFLRSFPCEKTQQWSRCPQQHITFLKVWEIKYTELTIRHLPVNTFKKLVDNDVSSRRHNRKLISVPFESFYYKRMQCWSIAPRAKLSSAPNVEVTFGPE